MKNFKIKTFPKHRSREGRQVVVLQEPEPTPRGVPVLFCNYVKIKI